MLRALKDSRPVLSMLVSLLRKNIARARATGDPDVLSGARSLYAVERRVLDCLAREKRSPEAYDALRDALAFLRDTASGPTARHYNARLNTLEQAARETVMVSYPTHGQFELTTRCNLRCPICTQSQIHTPERPEMTREDLARLAPPMQWMQDIRLFGFGESLLVDFLDEALDAAPDDAHTSLITNGLALNRERGRMLVDRRLKTLSISIDGADSATFEAIRGADAFDRVVGHAKELLRYRNETKDRLPYVGFVFVAMRRNIEQLPAYIRMIHDMGGDGVSVTYLSVYFESWRQESLFYHQDLAERCFDKAERVAAELGVDLLLPKRFSGKGGDPGRTRCVEPWKFAYFRADGGLSPCCILNQSYGSWRNDDFMDIWNGSAYRELRRTINTSNEPAACARCSHVVFRDVRQEGTHVPLVDV